MKKKLCLSFAVIVCLISFSAMVFAEEPDGVILKRFRPSISTGYAYMGPTNIVFEAKNIPLLGAGKFDVDLPGKSGSYVGGDFSFSFTDRLNLTVGGRLANAWTTPVMHEQYNGNPAIGRNWESDQQFSMMVEAMLAYAFVRNVSFVKNVSGTVGVRGDFQHIRFKDPSQASGVVSSVIDKMDLNVGTVSPVIGVTSTFSGFRSGIFGGDIKVGVSASPFALGSVKYEETFSPAGTKVEAEDNFYRSMMISASAEATVITAKINPKADLMVSIYGQYTRYFIDSEIEMQATGGSTGDFNFSMQPSMTIVGIKAAVEF
ncbi:MAG: hypothetical protein K4571_01850 [Deltaproteobacteria bacterium]